MNGGGAIPADDAKEKGKKSQGKKLFFSCGDNVWPEAMVYPPVRHSGRNLPVSAAVRDDARTVCFPEMPAYLFFL